jgi:hypothetical protein
MVRKQMKHLAFKIFICSLLPVFLLSCQSIEQDPTRFENAPLYGMIYDYQNRPVKAVRILLDAQLVAESDVNGRFYISELERGDHVITLSKEGYELKEVSFTFQNRTEALYLKFRSVFDCLSDANQLVSQRAYPEAAELIELGLSIDSDHTGLIFLRSIVEYKTQQFRESLSSIRLLFEEYELRDDSMYFMILDVAAARPELMPEVQILMEDFPPHIEQLDVRQRIAEELL